MIAKHEGRRNGCEARTAFLLSRFDLFSAFGSWPSDLRFQPYLVTPILWLAFLLLAGCKVGPDYHRPAPVSSNPLPANFSSPTNTTEWKSASPSAHLPRGAWWQVFEDAEMNRLEGLADRNNQQLASAIARFAQAR